MAFTKKVNVRNSAAVIKEVSQMLEAGFPKKETYVVVGKKYDLSYKAVQRIINGQTLDTSNKTLDTSTVTSADIVDGIMEKFGKKGDDYITAFGRAPKTDDGAVVMKNGSKVYF